MNSPADFQRRPIGSHAELAQLSANVLSMIAADTDLQTLLSRIVLEVHRVTGFESVGLRLKDGEDFPYYFTQGFDESFVKMERFLCARDAIGELIRDSEGNPYLECMCGNVISGRTNPNLPFFSPGGSFWTNNTSELLATTTDEDRQARTRNRCNGEGYETVALFPLRCGSTISGLLQLNDRRRGLLTPAAVSLLEGVATAIATTFRLQQAELEISRRVRDRRAGLNTRIAILERIAGELQTLEAAECRIPTALLTTLGEILNDMSGEDGIVSMCAVCKRVRQANDQWFAIEQFVSDRSHVQFSHGCCPACYKKAMREIQSPLT